MTVERSSSGKGTEIESDDRYRTEDQRKRVTFGQIALDLGFITSKELKEALLLQKKARTLERETPKLGKILVKKDYMTKRQAREVFRVQGRRGGHTEIEGFELQKKIGKGSMGTVFKARQLSMDRTVALKILSPKLAVDDEYIERFFQEARTVAKLNHPNIVQGIDVGESNGVHYFVMEYVDGPTFKEILDRGGAMDQGRALKYAIQITKALKHAHRHQMIHRDIKPENMMINSSGNAKLCDLGLAQVLTGDETKNAGLGTPNYISPEQAQRVSDLNIQTDIYSLGASFYHMLTGRVPYPGDSGKEVVRKHIQDPLLPPQEVNPELIDQTNRVVVRMMKKDRSQRYQNPQQLLDELQEAREAFEKKEKGVEEEEDQKEKKKGPTRRFRRRRR